MIEISGKTTSELIYNIRKAENKHTVSYGELLYHRYMVVIFKKTLTIGNVIYEKGDKAVVFVSGYTKDYGTDYRVTEYSKFNIEIPILALGETFIENKELWDTFELLSDETDIINDVMEQTKQLMRSHSEKENRALVSSIFTMVLEMTLIAVIAGLAGEKIITGTLAIILAVFTLVPLAILLFLPRKLIDITYKKDIQKLKDSIPYNK